MEQLSVIRLGRFLFLVLVTLALTAGEAGAVRFGRNKVQYRDFSWNIVRTEHFDVYYYPGSEDLADAVVEIVEAANADFEERLGHRLTTVIPVLVYASHNDFQQTNVSTTHLEETVGGFTELFKNRVVVPFTGSYDDLRHVLYHELTHVFMFDIVYGGLVQSVIRSAYTNPVPLWFVEGLAEYVSQGWDSEAEMILRDITVSDAVVPLPYLYGGYLVYKEGQSVLNFIDDRFGREKVTEIVRQLAKTRSMDRSLRDAIGMNTAELSDEWSRWLKQRYWPEVSDRSRPEDLAKLLTDHRRDTSYLNLGPEISPDGKRFVYVSDRTGYASIYLASALDGSPVRKLVEGERSDEFETLHILRTGFAWSPDGELLAFVAKAGESDALQIVDAGSGDLVSSLRFDLDGIFTPTWSPDGERIAFVGTKYGASDLYVTGVDGGSLERLTDDFYDDREPEWSPDGERIAFASDRMSPEWLGFTRDYDIFVLDLGTRDVRAVVAGPGEDASPSWSPDGRTLAYGSDVDGTPTLYFADLETGTSRQGLRLVGGAGSPSWARKTDRMVFSVYREGGWDVAVVRSPLERIAEADGLGDPFASVRPHAEPPVEEPEPPAEPEAPVGVEADSVAVSGVEPDETGAPDAGVESDTVRRIRDDYRSAVLAERREEPEETDREVGEVERYRTRFTPDWVDGGISYTSGYGVGGTAQLAFSDILGNHRFYVATDFFSSIEASNFQLEYEYLARRINYAFSVYHFKDYYYSERTRLGEDLGEKSYFTERTYGIAARASYPFSKFTRVELDVSTLALNRQFAEENEDGEIELTDEEVTRTLVTPSLRIVNDTTLWGMMGPVSGGRSSISISKFWPLEGDFNALTAIADVRRYVRIGARHTLALKLVAARSTQKNAQNFYMGGVNTLRGYDDFEFRGHNLGLMSLEWRYPFIDRLDIASPLPISLWGLRGILFLDLGAAWDDEFRGVTSQGGTRLKDIKGSYGFGVRMRLGFFVIRVDSAWQTDLRRTGERKTHFALGAEF